MKASAAKSQMAYENMPPNKPEQKKRKKPYEPARLVRL
jgi:hypothetical protein